MFGQSRREHHRQSARARPRSRAKRRVWRLPARHGPPRGPRAGATRRPGSGSGGLETNKKMQGINKIKNNLIFVSQQKVIDC